jgi:hypothetical protein
MEKNREEKFENFTEVMTIVALRKTEFFNKVWTELSQKIPEDFTENNKASLKDSIERIISHMSNKLFISEEESKRKQINPKLKISEIGIDERKLADDFYDSLRKEYPDLEI